MKFQTILSNNSKVTSRSLIFWPFSLTFLPIIEKPHLQALLLTGNQNFQSNNSSSILFRIIKGHYKAYLIFGIQHRPQLVINSAILTLLPFKKTAKKDTFISIVPQVPDPTKFYGSFHNSISRALSPRFHPIHFRKPNFTSYD